MRAHLALGVGALLMYFFDPNRGRRRRALVRDQLAHAARVLADSKAVTARDLRRRAQGVVAGTRRRFHQEGVDDRTVHERVRARLGRYVSHPHAVEVNVQNGTVTLAGPILADEVDDLFWCVRRVPGVKAVENNLIIYPRAGNIPSLQGGAPRSGDRFELMQENWSPSARLIGGVAGGTLLAGGLVRSGPAGLALFAIGLGLLARSAFNKDLSMLVGVGARRGFPVQKTIHIAAPVEEVFDFWNNPENFPKCMSKVRAVTQTGPDRWRWVVDGPAGVPVQWESMITHVEPNRRIDWASVEGAAVQHFGKVCFEPDERGGTRVDIQLEYVPIAGAVGHSIAKLFGRDPKSELDADMIRTKTLIETGRQPRDAAERAHA